VAACWPISLRAAARWPVAGGVGAGFVASVRATGAGHWRSGLVLGIEAGEHIAGALVDEVDRPRSSWRSGPQGGRDGGSGWGLERRPSMTMLPSLLRCIRRSPRVKASRSASLPGHGRMTSGPARNRVMGASPISNGPCGCTHTRPGLRRLVQERQRQIGDMLQHGHQPPSTGPRTLLLAF